MYHYVEIAKTLRHRIYITFSIYGHETVQHSTTKALAFVNLINSI